MGRLIVIRRAPDLPLDFHIGDLDGKWFDRLNVPWVGHCTEDDPTDELLFGGTAVARATGRYEQREDGAFAEVYEVRV